MSQPLPQEPEDSRPQGGFGAPIRRETPKPVAGSSKPSGAYGIVTGADGKMKTTRDNLPKSLLEEALEIWSNATNSDIDEDYLP